MIGPWVRLSRIAAHFKMSLVNSILKEFHFKVIYCGPENSGKRSALHYIASHSDPKKVFFADLDAKKRNVKLLIVNMGTILGFKTFFHVFNLPEKSREEENQSFLERADGVVFIADSHPESEERNKKALQYLHKNLEKCSKDIYKMPLALQYNKRDLNPKISIKNLRAGLNKHNNRDFESSLINGNGFMEPFKYICRSILMVLKSGELP